MPPVAEVGLTDVPAGAAGEHCHRQSALMSMNGWTWEKMIRKAPAALHIFWPDMSLDTTPKERQADPSKAKSLAEQNKERRKNVAAIQSFFDDARANIHRLWIAGHEVSLESRHTRLYERYRNRPR